MDPLVGCLVSLHALRLLAVDYNSRVAVGQRTKSMMLFKNAAERGPWSSSRMTPSASASLRNLLSMALSGMSKHPGHKYARIILLLVSLTQIVRYPSSSLGHSVSTNLRVRHWSESVSTFAKRLRRAKVLSWLRSLIPVKYLYPVAYVALSRATSLEGLEVHNFDPQKQAFPSGPFSDFFLIAFPRVIAHPRVIEWYDKLYKEWNEELKDSDEYDQYLTDEAYGFSSSQ